MRRGRIFLLMEFLVFARFFEAMYINQDAYKNYLWLYLLLCGVCYLEVYAFEAVALYTIASRNGVGRKWMAFVPVVNTYYMGVLSQKNSVYRLKANHIGIVAAVCEGLCLALAVLSYVATFLIFCGGYAEPFYTTQIYGGLSIEILDGYNLVGLPESLSWTVWVFNNLDFYITDWINIIYIIAEIMLLICFFQTYAAKNYLVFAIVSVLFPIKGIFMFVTRNNKAVNYRDYIMERQQRQYRMYQEYMRNNPPPQGGHGYNRQNSPYSNNSAGNSSSQDPFSEFGNGKSSSGSSGGGSASGEDPFDGLGN